MQPIIIVGEFGSYTLTTTALQYEHTIYFSDKTFDNLHEHFPDYYNGLLHNFGSSKNFSHYPVSRNGEFVKASFYFPAYSASCIPVSMIMDFLGKNQSYAFIITNILLLIASLLVVFKYLKVNTKTKFFLLLTLSINPIIYYIIWPSAEVFIYAFVVMSLVFFFNKAYRRSAFFLTIAGSMNITIMALGFFMIIIFFIDLQKEKGNGSSFIMTIYNNISCIIKYAASYIFIFLAFIYNYIISGNIFSTVQSGADFNNYYFDRFFAYLFDFNFGLFPWFNIVFLLYVVIIIIAILRLKYHYFLLAAGHIFVTLGFALMDHINSGMSGISRYNAWIAPVMLFITVIYFFEENIDFKTIRYFSLNKLITNYPIIKSGVIILSVFLTTFLMFFLGFQAYRHIQYMIMQRPASFILNRVPDLYNPLYSTFISRVEHRDGGYDYREPVFYIDSRTNHKDQIRKILIRRSEKDTIKNFLIFDDKNSSLYFESKIKKIKEKGSEFIYLNIPPKYKIKNMKYTLIEILLFNSSSINNSYLIKGFSDPEDTHIWTDQEEAEIRIPIKTTESDLRLTIRGIRLTPLQTVEFVVNDRVYGSLKDGDNVFIIRADELIKQNFLNIKLIISKPYTPKELDLGDDMRTLGFALQAIGLYEIIP